LQAILGEQLGRNAAAEKRPRRVSASVSVAACPTRPSVAAARARLSAARPPSPGRERLVEAQPEQHAARAPRLARSSSTSRAAARLAASAAR
jgi:hypothetical protein